MKDLKAVSTLPQYPLERETRYVDWTDLFFGTGCQSELSVVCKWNEKLQYFVSGGYS